MTSLLNYIWDQPVSEHSKKYIEREAENIYDFDGQRFVLTQTHHIPSGKRWLTVHGFIEKESTLTNGQTLYELSLIEDQTIQEQIKELIKDDDSLEGRICFQGRYNRGP